MHAQTVTAPPTEVPRIARVELAPLAIPYPKPRRFGKHTLTAGENILVRVRSEAGDVGIGEAVARPFVYGESGASIVHAIREWFGPAMIGRSPFDTEAIWERWDLVAFNYAAKAALDMALHDLQARVVGLPLWRWLGGTGDPVGLSWILTYDSPERMLEEAVAWSERGFGSFKVKISADRDNDRRVLDALVDGLPRGTRLYADANGTLQRSDFVLRAAELVDFGIELLEDPLPTGDLAGRRATWPAAPIPILADETAKSVAEAATEIDSGGVDAFSIKIFRTGLRRSQEIALLARAFDRQCLVGGQGETQVGAAIGAHFASGLVGLGFDRYLAETSSSYRYDFDFVAAGPRLRDGRVELGDAPGSGVVLDEDVVARFASAPWASIEDGAAA